MRDNPLCFAPSWTIIDASMDAGLVLNTRIETPDEACGASVSDLTKRNLIRSEFCARWQRAASAVLRIAEVGISKHRVSRQPISLTRDGTAHAEDARCCVGRERVCKDDASAQTVFESAIRGWGDCRARIFRPFAGQIARKKRQNGYRCYQHDDFYRVLKSISTLTPCEGRKCSDQRHPWRTS